MCFVFTSTFCSSISFTVLTSPTDAAYIILPFMEVIIIMIIMIMIMIIIITLIILIVLMIMLLHPAVHGGHALEEHLPQLGLDGQKVVRLLLRLALPVALQVPICVYVYICMYVCIYI